MKQVRMVIHPVLGHKRSRFILFTYLFVGALSNGVLWWLTLRVLKAADISIFSRGFHPSWYVDLLTSPVLHVSAALMAIVVGATITSTWVVGPVKRLEQWLKDWEAGHNLRPFKVRDNDHLYENVASLINQLHEKSANE